MSFARSKTKRFNDVSSCAPPVGAYDPKQEEKNGMSIGKSDRFRANKDLTPGPNAFDISTCTLDESSSSQKNITPAKQLFRKPTSSGKGLSKAKNSLWTSCPDLSKNKELENEIKKLINERVECEKRLAQKEDEFKRIEGRLHQTQKDRSSLEATVASLEKNNAELTKGNECLKNKLSQNDGYVATIKQQKSEIAQLKEQLLLKDKEIVKLQNELKNSQVDLGEEIQSLRDIIADLRDKNTFLEKQIQEAHVEREQLQGELEEMRNMKQVTENEKSMLQEKLSSMEKDCTDLTASIEKELKLKAAAEEVLSTHIEETSELRSAFQMEITKLEENIQVLTQQKLDESVKVKDLEGKLCAVGAEAIESKSSLDEAIEKLQEMSLQIANLEETEDILNCNIRLISEKYEVLENNYFVVKREKMEQIELLNRELSDSRDRFQQVENSNKSLLASLCIEKKSHETFERKCEELVKKIDSVEEKNKKSIQEVEDEKQAVVNELIRVKEDISNLDDERKNELALVQEKCTKIEEDKQNLQTNMKHQLDKSREDKENVEKQLSEFKAEYDWMHNSLTKELTKVVDEKENLEKEWRNLQDVFNTMETDTKEKIEAIVSEKDELSNKLKNTQDQFASTETTTKKLVQEIEDQKSAHMFEIENLNTELEEKNDEINTLIKLKAEVHLTVDELQETIGAIESERDVYMNQLQEITKHNEVLFEEVNELKEQTIINSSLKKEAVDASLTIDNIKKENKYLKERMQELKEQLEANDEKYRTDTKELKEALEKQQEELTAAIKHVSKICQAKAAIEETKLQLAEECVQLKLEIKKLKKEPAELLKLHRVEVTKIKNENDVLKREVSKRENTVSELQEELEKTQNTAELDELRVDAERWKSLYEELWQKVEPFQEQLDMYESRKEALLRTNKDTKAELEKMSKDFAKLVGHQNHKQKIQHVIKITEEKRALREENAALREQLDRQKRQTTRLNEKLQSTEAKSKSVRHKFDKENMPPVSPMKTSNR